MTINDYKIVPYTLTSARTVGQGAEKFKIMCAGKAVTVKNTYEEAAREIVKLVMDPYYHDRGYTRLDRAAAW